MWTNESISERLQEIRAKGFIEIPDGMHRTDDGVVGQVLERAFNIEENNIHTADLGVIELKAIRATSSTVTLCHMKPEAGMSPIQIFSRFGYNRPSNRNPQVMKKKLFMTTKGNRTNRRGFILKPIDSHRFSLYFEQERISDWNLQDRLGKMNSVLLVSASTRGRPNSAEEAFHFRSAILFRELKPLDTLVENGIMELDLCIDQIVGESRIHDRGPHIRIKKAKLQLAYATNEVWM